MVYRAERLAEYIEQSSFDDLPEDVIHTVKLCIRDSIGCSLGGSTTDIGQILIDTIEAFCQGGPCTVMGSAYKTTAPYAAYVNGSLADILDYNDIFRGHLGATIIAPAIAIGEMKGCTGKELINACCLGYEVSSRVGTAVAPRPNPWSMGHGFGTYQTFGAVTAASKLLALSKEETMNALGIAGANAPLPCNMKTVEGPLGNSSMVKNNFGSSALNGVLSAMLAKKGFMGPADIFDGDNGFWRMYGSDQCDFDKLTEGLGNTYLVRNMGFKAYSACGATHGAIDAVKGIMKKHGTAAEEVETIIVKVPTAVAKMPWSNPETSETMYEAQFSMPYIIAITITGIAGTPGPGWYTEDKLKNSKVKEIIKKVKLEADAECDHLRSSGMLLTKVEINTKGNKYFERVEFARGHVSNPLSEGELEDKFKYLAALAISKEKTESLAQTLTNLENLDQIDGLVDLLR